MGFKSIHYSEKDSANLSAFDARDDHSYITLKDEPKSWITDSLLGKTIYLDSIPDIRVAKISLLDTFHASSYIIEKGVKLENVRHAKKYVTSIFRNHNLKSKTIEPKFRIHDHNDWSLPFFLIGFLLLSIANVYYVKRFSLYVKAFFFSRFVTQLMREDNSQTQRLSILLSLVYLFAVSMFAININDVYNAGSIQLNHGLQFSILILSLFCFFVFKIALNYLVGFIFKTSKEIEEYTFNIILMNQFLGIGLLLLSFMLYYVNHSLGKVLIYVGLSLMAATYMYRIGRGIVSVSNNKHISAVYLFLYFCTLEILPVVFIIKIIIDR